MNALGRICKTADLPPNPGLQKKKKKVQMNCSFALGPMLVVSCRTVQAPERRTAKHCSTSQLLVFFPVSSYCVSVDTLTLCAEQLPNTAAGKLIAETERERGSVLTIGHPRYMSNYNTAVELQFSSVFQAPRSRRQMRVCPCGRKRRRRRGL